MPFRSGVVNPSPFQLRKKMEDNNFFPEKRIEIFLVLHYSFQGVSE
jgi:hypothetical protein